MINNSDKFTDPAIIQNYTIALLEKLRSDISPINLATGEKFLEEIVNKVVPFLIEELSLHGFRGKELYDEIADELNNIVSQLRIQLLLYISKGLTTSNFVYIPKKKFPETLFIHQPIDSSDPNNKIKLLEYIISLSNTPTDENKTGGTFVIYKRLTKIYGYISGRGNNETFFMPVNPELLDVLIKIIEDSEYPDYTELFINKGFDSNRTPSDYLFLITKYGLLAITINIT
jgi:hypothetical protein